MRSAYSEGTETAVLALFSDGCRRGQGRGQHVSSLRRLAAKFQSRTLRDIFDEGFEGKISRVESSTKKPEGTAASRRLERPSAQTRLVVRSPDRGLGSGVRANLALGSRGTGHFGAGVPGSGSP